MALGAGLLCWLAPLAGWRPGSGVASFNHPCHPPSPTASPPCPEPSGRYHLRRLSARSEYRPQVFLVSPVSRCLQVLLALPVTTGDAPSRPSRYPTGHAPRLELPQNRQRLYRPHCTRARWCAGHHWRETEGEGRGAKPKELSGSSSGHKLLKWYCTVGKSAMTVTVTCPPFPQDEVQYVCTLHGW